MKKEDLPNILPVFPLSNFIIFPKTTVPLNIFEPRYLQMVDTCMKKNRIIGMIQPKKTGELKKPDLHEVGCAGKIVSFNETDDGRYIIILNGVCRFKILEEVKNDNIVARSTNFLISVEKYNITIKVPIATTGRKKFLDFFWIGNSSEHLLRTFGKASRQVIVVLNIAQNADKRIRFLAPSPREEYNSANWPTKLDALAANSTPEP